MMLSFSSLIDMVRRSTNPPETVIAPQDDVTSPEYQHRVLKAIHDAETQEIAERKASAAELKKGNRIGAKRHLQMAKLLENDRIQTDIKNGQAIVISLTEKVRALLPTPIELPTALANSDFYSDLAAFNDEEPISADALRELEENAKAMEEREKTVLEPTLQSEIHRLMEDE